METAFHPLAELKSRLLEMGRLGDARALADCLEGTTLPAMGGGLDPAEMLFEALSYPPFDPDLPHNLGKLTATVCRRTVAVVVTSAAAAAARAGTTTATQAGIAKIPWESEPLVYNLFLFATYLPATEELFTALYELRHEGLGTRVLVEGDGRSERQFRQALVYQQTDDRLAEHWLEQLAASSQAGSGVLDAEAKTALLDAWTGLLWIPPTPAQRQAGETVDGERVARGLEALHSTVAQAPDGVRILRYAVKQLDQAHPRDPGFWARILGPRLDAWPELLVDVLVERWPPLASPQEGEEDTPEPREAWLALGEQPRAAIESAAAGNPEAWGKLWLDLLVPGQPPAGTPPQKWRQDLNRLRNFFEKRRPQLASASKGLRPVAGDEEEPPEPAAPRRARRESRNRLEAYERVGKVLAEVERQLERRELGLAQEFLRDLVAHQDQADTPPSLVVKTMCNAAALAVHHGQLPWAQDLYVKAQGLGVDDPVPHTGLAEALKAQGKLQEAEKLYKNTIQRWPENVVAHNGLAETLKAQDKLQEAEKLYNNAIQRWPENVVAHTGLAETLKAQDKLQEAEKLYKNTIQRWTHDVVAHNGLAETLKAQDKLQEAEKLYKNTIQRWPHDVVAHNGLAETLKAQDKLQEAEKLYKNTIQRWPHNVVAHTGLAETLKAQDKLQEAEKLYRTTMQRWPGDRVARHGLANLLRRTRRFPEALELLPESTAPRSPRDRYDLHLRGMILLESGKPDAAAELFESCLEWPLSPGSQRLFRLGLSLARLRLRRYDEATAELARLEPSKPQTKTLLLHAAAGAGDAERAHALHRELGARILTFPRVVREPFVRLETAFGLHGEGLRQPEEAEVEGVVAAEVEMLLAA